MCRVTAARLRWWLLIDMITDVLMTPQDAWDHVSDLLEPGDWLIIHEGIA